MIGGLFKNPKAALAYVAFTLVGVWLFVGTESSPGSLQQTVSQFSDGKTAQDRAAERKFGGSQPAQSENPNNAVGGNRRAKPKKSAEEEGEFVGFATDEDLLDGADGFDPTPEDVFDGFDPTPEEEGMPRLSDQDKRDAEKAFGGWATEPEGEE